MVELVDCTFYFFVIDLYVFVWIFAEEMHIQSLPQMKRSVKQCKKVRLTFVLIFWLHTAL